MSKTAVWFLVIGVWLAALGMNWQAMEQHRANYIMINPMETVHTPMNDPRAYQYK